MSWEANYLILCLKGKRCWRMYTHCFEKRNGKLILKKLVFFGGMKPQTLFAFVNFFFFFYFSYFFQITFRFQKCEKICMPALFFTTSPFQRTRFSSRSNVPNKSCRWNDKCKLTLALTCNTENKEHITTVYSKFVPLAYCKTWTGFDL